MLVANAFCVKLLIAIKEFVLVLMAASVEAVILDVCRVELKMFVANAFCVKLLIAVSELVLVLMAASVEAVILDVCRVEL